MNEIDTQIKKLVEAQATTQRQIDALTARDIKREQIYGNDFKSGELESFKKYETLHSGENYAGVAATLNVEPLRFSTSLNVQRVNVSVLMARNTSITYLLGVSLRNNLSAKIEYITFPPSLIAVRSSSDIQAFYDVSIPGSFSIVDVSWFGAREEPTKLELTNMTYLGLVNVTFMGT